MIGADETAIRSVDDSLSVPGEGPFLGPPKSLSEHRLRVRHFLEVEVEPYVEEWERIGEVPLHTVLADLARAGLMGLRFQERPAGEGLWRHVALLEELGRSSASGLGLSFMAHADMVLPLLVHYGSEEIEERFLRPGLVGAAVFSHILSDHGAAIDVHARPLAAERQADVYVLNGATTFVVNAAIADAHCVLAVVADRPPPCNTVVLIVPAGLDGIAVGPPFRAVGNRSAPIATAVRFIDVRVPVGCLMGAEGMGLSYQAKQSQQERPGGVQGDCGGGAISGTCPGTQSDSCGLRHAAVAPSKRPAPPSPSSE